ncbi:uncharacterized protein LOC129952787 [Eupeodes corollae]|uniref:uncharacterized protein LOC129952787 n=1 Tax=Eupeodes corollae TaxID=290404 RepID=UPI0024907792|nr:uncharacterized protein LOC129952787 [Eupeodes corollae]
MKNSTIWESASRPLFVKSVWLEAGQRHFILDYEPKQKLDSSSNLRSKRSTVQSSAYCEYSGLDEELRLVGSSKVQCRQNFSEPKFENATTGTYRRLSSRNPFIDHFKKRCDFLREEAPSKRSSLHDISSVFTNNSHSDEKLAERVLNWLDLAGKAPLLRPIHQTSADSVQRKVKKDQSTRKMQPKFVCSQRNDSIKHITIIFNKEGVPVRFNRPARNIDLCAISSSAGAARRLAGSLASGRLYEENICREVSSGARITENRRPRPKTTCPRRNFTYNGINTKKPKAEWESSAIRNAKRQLHIFMPSLPKKTIINEEMVCNDLNSRCKINSSKNII